jgi:DNA-binding MarR family transcriptional regulator
VSDTDLAEVFFGASRALRRRTKEAFLPWDLSPSLARALNVLTRDGDCRPGALAERLRIVPRSATEVVDELQRRGLVERHPDPADRRATLVSLTAEGRRVSAAIRQARDAEGERFFAALTPGDRQELARILRKLVD